MVQHRHYLSYAPSLLLATTSTSIDRFVHAPLHLTSSASPSVVYELLFQDYTARCYYWSVVVIVRRTLCSAIAAALYNDTSGRSLGIFVVQFGALLLHLSQQPFRHRVNNHLETVALSVLVLISAIVSSYQTAPYPNAMQALVCLLIVLTIAVVGVVIAASTLFTKKRREHAVTMKTHTNKMRRSQDEEQSNVLDQATSTPIRTIDRMSRVELHRTNSLNAGQAHIEQDLTWSYTPQHLQNLQLVKENGN